MKKHFLSFILLALTLGWSANAMAGTTVKTFNKGDVIYIDLRNITDADFGCNIFQDNGGNYSAEVVDGSATRDNANGDYWKNCNSPVIKVTFTNSAELQNDYKNIYKSGTNNWSPVYWTSNPTGSQNMIIANSQASSYTWGTYAPDPCPNCKTITKP